MEKDALGEILRVESLLREKIESERLKAEAEIEAAQKAAEAAMEAERLRLGADISLRLERAREDSIKQAEERIKEARRLAERLENAPEELLSSAVIKSIRRILPASGAGA